MIKTILWDFDGVILDSMEVRDWGFEKVFEEFSKPQIEKLLRYHRENGGLSRYVKIRYFFEEIIGISISDREVLLYAQKFSELMRHELVNPENLIMDSVRFIKENYKNYNFHIVSGSDQEELRFLNYKLGISKYFKSIYGSPTPKNELVSHVLDNYSYVKEECVLIGDSINDYVAAKINNINFIGYGPDEQIINKSTIDSLF